MEVLIEIEPKGKTPLDFLASLKAWLEAELKGEYIEEYAILQEVGQEVDYQILDQSPPKAWQERAKKTRCPECLSIEVVEDPETKEQICKGCGYLVRPPDLGKGQVH